MRIRHGAHDRDSVQRVAEPGGCPDIRQRSIPPRAARLVNPHGLPGNAVVIAPSPAERRPPCRVSSVQRETPAGRGKTAFDEIRRNPDPPGGNVNRSSRIRKTSEQVRMGNLHSRFRKDCKRSRMYPLNLIITQHTDRQHLQIPFIPPCPRTVPSSSSSQTAARPAASSQGKNRSGWRRLVRSHVHASPLHTGSAVKVSDSRHIRQHNSSVDAHRARFQPEVAGRRISEPGIRIDVSLVADRKLGSARIPARPHIPRVVVPRRTLTVAVDNAVGDCAAAQPHSRR